MKEELIYNKKMYLKVNRTDKRVEGFFNLKNNDNDLRGHFAIVSGSGMYSDISLPWYLRNDTGFPFSFTIESDGIYLHAGTESFRF